MKAKIVFVLLLLFLLGVLWASQAKAADTLTVCASGCDYTTITAALAAASSGDTIEVQDSREYLQIGGWNGDNIYLRHSAGETPAIARRPTDQGWDNILSLSGDSNTVDGFWFGPSLRGNGIVITGDRNTITNCTIDSIYPVDFAGGDSGEGLVIGDGVSQGAKYNVISNCTFLDCAHGALSISSVEASSDSSKFNQVINNTFNNRYGHGVSLLREATLYNLVEGNVIRSDSLSDDRHQKQCMQISGASHNTIRKNVMYNGYSRTMEVSVYGGGDGDTLVGNWIYNNTFFDCTWRNTNTPNSENNFWVGITAVNDADNVIADNKFYNNIVVKAGQEIIAQSYSPANGYGVWSILYGATATHHAGTDSTNLINNDWNGNILKNNCIRVYHKWTGAHTHNAYHLDCDYAVRYQVTDAFSFRKSVTDVNGLGSMADNFTSDPLLSDTTTVASDWWHIPANSPCVDAGTALIGDDPNANHGGWDTLVWYGSAPDVGAYETEDTDVTVSPGRAETDATAVNPTVLADMLVSPARAEVDATAVNPTVYADVFVSPTRAEVDATAVNPTVAAVVDTIDSVAKHRRRRK